MLRHVLSVLIGLDVGNLTRYFKNREITCGVVKPPFIIRLDGVGFGSKLRGFSWPRDENVHKALVEAGKDAMNLLGADLCYIVSDELSLVFIRYAPYGGRVFKLISVSSGIVSSRVSLILGRHLYFDSRVIKIDSVEDIRKYLLCRARVGLNNYLSSIAASRKMFQKGYTPTIDELISVLRSELRKPEWMYIGTLLVREQITKRAVDRVSGREVEVKRNIVRETTIEMLLQGSLNNILRARL